MTGFQGLASGGGDADPARHRGLKLGFFAVWVVLVVAMAARHTVFRDEVRALTLALQGPNVMAMLAGIHGEGHPAVWYLLLRAAHALWHSPLVLPAISIAVAAGAALLGVLRGPFAWWMVLLGLLSRFAVFEYSVMARNYGISVLLMFAVAALYARGRRGGLWLGVLLALLANTNIHSVILPAGPLDYLLGLDPQHAPALLGGAFGHALLEIGGSLALYAAALSLIRHPAACLAALASLIGLSVFSAVISHGFYRHDALWLAFVISLHWILRSGSEPPFPWSEQLTPRVASISKVCCAVLIALMATQAEAGALTVVSALRAPPSRFPGVVQGRADLRQAVIIADPDFLLEAMPYALANPTWLVREDRWGPVVHFTRKARLSLSPADLLGAARQLRAKTGRPVLILVQTPLRTGALPTVVKEGYDWELRLAPADVSAFLAATQPLGHFAQASEDGDFDAYLLK